MTTHICGAICGEALEEVHRRPDGEPRWCFQCRARRVFELVVMAPVPDRENPSYYGPEPHIECPVCRTWNTDLFPGRERAWEDQ